MKATLGNRTETLRVLIVILMTMVGTCAFAAHSKKEEKKDTLRGNLYLKFNLDVNKRNILLQAVPDLYNIASGPSHHMGESYGRYEYDTDRGKYQYHEQLRVGTIRRQRMVFENTLTYVTPSIYSEEVFHGFILSPFNKRNRRMYRYTVQEFGDIRYLLFRPRVRNSVLTRGMATINKKTGKVIEANFRGEFDQIEYNVEVEMDSLKDIPATCNLYSVFKMFGNNVSTHLYANYKYQTALPDTIKEKNNLELMTLVREDTLSQEELEAYAEKYKKEEPDTQKTERKRNIFEKTWRGLDKYLIGSIRFGNENARVKLSPILDPLAVSYSSSKGVSYRLKLRSSWDITENSYLTLNSRMGYYFKRKQFFFKLPLKYTFDDKRNGYVELYFANGNRISNSRILEQMKGMHKRDTIDFKQLELNYFNDRELSLESNIPIGRHFHVGFATIYHKREGVNKEKLRELGERTAYHSFAPSLTFKYRPSSYAAYVLNYEHGIPNIFGCDTKYERFEADALFAIKYNTLTSLNFRVGAGVYTDMSSTYFVDYNNFTENYLPETWDEWTGRFFLLDSDLYNASSYYLRANVSYESPMLPLAYIPFLGYYVEKERIYLSALQLYRTRPYFEVGYAFSTRFAAFGLFASSFGTKFKEIGTKITFELFNRW